MRKRTVRLLLATLSAPILFQAGCLSTFDVRTIAESQFISFINILINATTSDAIRGAIGA